MRRPNVTELLRNSLEICGGLTAVIATLLALGSTVQATQPAAGDATGIVIVPLQSATESSELLVPPAPEAPLAALQPADPFVAAGPDFTTAQPTEDVASADHGITIVPTSTVSVEVNGRTYEDVYRSIPYNYTEYLANPGYRHEATMEILFGQLRPTTVVKQYEPQVIQNEVPSPYQPYRWSHSERWQYRAPDFRLLDPGCCW